MSLHLYNSLTRQKELFEPANKEKVGMYVCGPTVYDLAHIGNARPIIVFDVLYRILVRLYGFSNVQYVRNITDIDDKINHVAIEKGISIDDVTQPTIIAFHQDIKELNALPPTVEPRATEHIPEIIALIKQLIERGHAYEAEGHVIFSVESDPNYGSLSGQNLSQILEGARVEVATYKRSPADFILWKPSDKKLPGWNSPWGRGRPGWHIECSAMSRKHIGNCLDIHGGGLDLIFPHHENEIAQSECSHPEHKFVRYWVHNGYLTVNGEKMSKSLGNFVTIRQALTDSPGEAIRLFMLGSHYRAPIDWNQRQLDQAKSSIDRLYTSLRHAEDVEVISSQKKPSERIISALEDDLNTPAALAELYRLASELNKAGTIENRSRLKGLLISSAQLLGLLENNVNSWFLSTMSKVELPAKDIEKMIQKRAKAREERNFTESDSIRNFLEEKGVILEDSITGTKWRRNR
ncbi:MAG: cysteine--tRNA ligase [Gammaproteobacteria bacterium]|nr:cysteine--tRNA ligase [Gammaproteobacteria bacterium]